MKVLLQFTFLLLTIYLLSVTACVHEPVFIDDDMMPPIDTMEVDTMTPCDPTVIYFERDVLPILKANCAQSGCHDVASAQEDIILDSYENVMASDVIEAFDPDDSELYERITETDNDKRMPPPPANSLAPSQITTIREWIIQGARNEMCDDMTGGDCDTVSVTYSGHIAPAMITHCRTCHSGAAPAGGYDFTSHAGVNQAVLNGRLLGAIRRDQGFLPMPQAGDKLDPCTITQFEIWVADGAPNN